MDGWQDIAAPAVVAVTLGVFVVRFLTRKSRKRGCGGGCGCDLAKAAKPPLSGKR